jgi:hypothetical protein
MMKIVNSRAKSTCSSQTKLVKTTIRIFKKIRFFINKQARFFQNDIL